MSSSNKKKVTQVTAAPKITQSPKPKQIVGAQLIRRNSPKTAINSPKTIITSPKVSPAVVKPGQPAVVSPKVPKTVQNSPKMPKSTTRAPSPGPKSPSTPQPTRRATTPIPAPKKVSRKKVRFSASVLEMSYDKKSGESLSSKKIPLNGPGENHPVQKAPIKPPPISAAALRVL